MINPHLFARRCLAAVSGCFRRLRKTASSQEITPPSSKLPGDALVQQQIEGDQKDLERLALYFVLQHGEVGGAVLARHDDLTVDNRATGTDVPGVVPGKGVFTRPRPKADVDECLLSIPVTALTSMPLHR
jgi:hypothetical protein